MNKNLQKNIILILLLSLSTLAYSSPKENNKSKHTPSSKVVASVGKLIITADELKNGYDCGPAFYKKEKKSKEVYLKFLINEKLLALDGYNQKVDTTKQVIDMFKAFHDDLITDELFNDVIFSKIKVNNQDIDSIITQKQLELNIKWIFTPNKDEAIGYYKSLKNGADFNLLFDKQSGDSAILNNRQLKTNLYDLKLKNPVMVKFLDTLKVGNVTLPIHAQDGWYLVKLENISRNLITTETDVIKQRSESIEAFKMNKMDRLSEQYVNNLMNNEKPVIRKDEFGILCSYIGNYILPKEKYKTWRLAERMDSCLFLLKSQRKNNIPNLKLVDMNSGSITLSEFLNWYWTRDQYIKLDNKDIIKFSFSLKQMIWIMVRDKLLVAEANKRKLSERQNVKEQERWWRDKIVYSYVRNELTNVVLEANKEIPSEKNDAKKTNNDDELSFELSKKILHKINMIKQKVPVNINDKILNSINVIDENDPKAIELYIVKKGGLIPRLPYPAIDNDWKSWE